MISIFSNFFADIRKQVGLAVSETPWNVTPSVFETPRKGTSAVNWTPMKVFKPLRSSENNNLSKNEPLMYRTSL